MTALKSVKESAELLGLSVHTLNHWRVQGRGPRFVKLGGKVGYRPEDLTDFINASTRRSTSETEAA